MSRNYITGYHEIQFHLCSPHVQVDQLPEDFARTAWQGLQRVGNYRGMVIVKKVASPPVWRRRSRLRSVQGAVDGFDLGDDLVGFAALQQGLDLRSQ